MAIAATRWPASSAGAERRDLFVTTAKHKLEPAELAAQPLAGSLFRARSPYPGQPLNRFAG